MAARGGRGVRLLAGTLLGALVLLAFVTCGDTSTAGACGQGDPVDTHVKLPELIFACSAADVDGQPVYQLWRLLPHGGAQRLSSAPAQDPAVTPSGSRLAYDSTVSGMPQVYVSALDLKSRHPVAGAPGGQTQPAWSHDGSHLAYVSGQLGLHAPVGVSDAFGTIFVCTAGGGAARQITPVDAYYGEPAWAPNGRHIAYATDSGDGFWNVGTITPDRTHMQMLTGGSGNAQWPTWSSDSSKIAYQWSTSANGDDSIWVMSAGGGDPSFLTYGSRPSWSPDGKWIAFVRMTDQGSDLWMISPEGGHAIRLTDDAGLKGRPTWVQ